jgi:hypothetical protein
MTTTSIKSGFFGLAASLLVMITTGCNTPSKANVELRKQNAQLTSQINALRLQQDGDEATIRSLQTNQVTVPQLPQDRVDQLFTAHGLTLGKLTGDVTDSGFNVYAVPIDEQNTPLKAAGSFTVQAFDLADTNKPLVGSWSFDLKQTRDLFYDHFMLYTYVLPCPWQTIPRHDQLTIRATFHDELTGREFTAQKEAHVTLPTTTAPSGK